jgi:protein SSD1
MQNHVYDEHSNALSIYWSTKDVITWLAENSDDEHLKRIKRQAELHAQNMEVSSRAANEEAALFDDDDEAEDEVVLGRANEETEPVTSKQRLLSMSKAKPAFEGLRTSASGHKIQDIKEFMTVPVRPSV